MSTYESLAIWPNVYYTVDETAQLLRVSQKSVLQLLKSGRAKGLKIEQQWRILGAALLNLSAHQQDTETELVADWFAASSPSLEEIWDNEENAIYDNL
ncbi:MAG: helix-turn-helix domain-containing protein [Ardenticatenaceae bacterium]